MIDVPLTLFKFLQDNVMRNESWPEPCVPSGHINCDMEEDNKVEILRISDPVEMRKQIGWILMMSVVLCHLVHLHKVTTCCVLRKPGLG